MSDPKGAIGAALLVLLLAAASRLRIHQAHKAREQGNGLDEGYVAVKKKANLSSRSISARSAFVWMVCLSFSITSTVGNPDIFNRSASTVSSIRIAESDRAMEICRRF
jgi:hypothetical protein